MDFNSSYELITATRYDRFLSTLAWNIDREGPSDFLLLQYHLDRLWHAAELHGWDKAKSSLTYDRLKSVCQTTVSDYANHEDTSSALKVRLIATLLLPHALNFILPQIRLVLSKTGSLTATVSPTFHFTSDPTDATLFDPAADDHPANLSSSLTVYVDSQPTPTSIFTWTKTTERTFYNDARARIGLPPTPAESDVLLYNTDNLITETSIFNVAFYRSSSWITPAATTGCLPGVFRRWLLGRDLIREADSHSLTKESVKEGECVLLFNAVQGCRVGKIARRNPKTV
jgi:branched-subunit amino acid aminotransferase/4-amino-4-deoxychorismate lyase